MKERRKIKGNTLVTGYLVTGVTKEGINQNTNEKLETRESNSITGVMNAEHQDKTPKATHERDQGWHEESHKALGSSQS